VTFMINGTVDGVHMYIDKKNVLIVLWW